MLDLARRLLLGTRMRARFLTLLLALASTACHHLCDTDADCDNGQMCSDQVCVGIPTPSPEGHLAVATRAGAVSVHAGDATPGTTFGITNDGDAALNFSIACG
ncbi:MAG: hypothetical protein JST92_09700, partial [Deltaproteobacteria bacterium]|nr:hypothetical protein [Deltaproteobacteria bacterium]